MEKRTIRSGVPFAAAGAAVLAVAVVLGIGSLFSYVIAAAAGVLGFAAGKKAFPDREIEVERAPQSGSAEVDALIAEARAQLDAIAQANEAIAEGPLSSQIADIENTCRAILVRLEEQPNMLAQLRTFLRYYLPATLKLLQERAKLEDEVNAGQSAQIAQKIREAMGQVQTALHRQLDALNEFRFINLESEMDVLADMLAGDGLLAGEETEQAQPGEAPADDPFAGLFAQGGK
ncbi:MAG: 5-bromo-4-chloroindolyl phosphate hydrolysis family protein [Clostridia bacterium]|nr:5-bromo-4-chloroindolyl phosphate hydrolysis family protein [Clostridia bacterium]